MADERWLFSSGTASVFTPYPARPASVLLSLGRAIFPEGESPMCIAVPAEVIEKKEGNIAVVDYGDLQQEVRVDLVDVNVGEFVLVHVGFAIQKLSREEALETREIFRQVYAAMEE
jgi:hydrogenase expression/formation protein HypC